MILRRLAEHVRAQNWPAVAVELAIVFVGVFLGIQASNWNAARLEREAARTYIERIREDLAANVTDLRFRIDYYQQVKQHALAALDAFGRPAESLGEQFLIDAYQASQITPRTLGRSTYDEILSVGAINSLSSIDTRRRLANFYLNVQTQEVLLRYIPPYRESLRRHMPYSVQVEITSRCAERVGTDPDGTPTLRLAEGCVLDLSSDRASAAVAAILNPELKLDLTRALSDIDTKLNTFQVVIDRAQMLDGHLERSVP
jgi:hypothetical protein